MITIYGHIKPIDVWVSELKMVKGRYDEETEIMVKQMKLRKLASVLSPDEVYAVTPSIESLCLKLCYVYCINEIQDNVDAVEQQVWREFKALTLDEVGDSDSMWCEMIMEWIGNMDLESDVYDASLASYNFYTRLGEILEYFIT